jgi:hypothetical protein
VCSISGFEKPSKTLKQSDTSMVCPLMKKISMSGQLKKKDKNKIATTKKPIVL